MIQVRAQEAVNAVSRQAHVRAAYLFGSHVTGTADQFSDIDIAAFIEEFESWDIQRRTRVATETQKQVGDDVELHFFSTRMSDHAPPASFAAFVQNHGIRIDV